MPTVFLYYCSLLYHSQQNIARVRYILSSIYPACFAKTEGQANTRVLSNGISQ